MADDAALLSIASFRPKPLDPVTTPLHQPLPPLTSLHPPPSALSHLTLSGELQLPGASQPLPLGPVNMLLRGCLLQTTEWALGLVVQVMEALVLEEGWREG